MHVWFHPADEPGIYAVDRSDPDNPIFIISDGLPMETAAACAARFATIAERDWVRERIGSPKVAEDPSYEHVDRMSRGEACWDRSMIPEGMLWQGPNPCPVAERSGGGVVALVAAAAAAAMVGMIDAQVNGTSGLFTSLLT